MSKRTREPGAALRVEKLESGAEGTVYRALLPQPLCKRGEGALRFTVTPQGALIFDNRQPDARLCARRRVGAALAEAMTRTAQAQVPGAQAGRTQKGVARELRVHRRAYALGLKRSHSVTTELGSPDPAAPDYDDNALWFERPLRSLPGILRALFK